MRRFRPISLTAAAAVFAMIPPSRSVLWGPMAVAIMGGLIVATALTILAVPAIYAAWYRIRPEPLLEIEAWLAPYRRFWAERLDALERHLDTMPDEPEPRSDE